MAQSTDALLKLKARDVILPLGFLGGFFWLYSRQQRQANPPQRYFAAPPVAMPPYRRIPNELAAHRPGHWR